VRRALIEQAAELRAFREIATLQEVEVELPPDRPTDWLGGAAAAREFGMNRLAERLEKAAE
jgi:DNA polymerase-1